MKCFYLLLLFCIARIGYGQDMNKLAQTTSFLQSLPSAFEENNGQVWDKDNKTASYVKYPYQQGGINIFMLPTGTIENV